MFYVGHHAGTCVHADHNLAGKENKNKKTGPSHFTLPENTPGLENVHNFVKSILVSKGMKK